METKIKTNLKRTTVFLTDEQHEELRRIAFERHTSMANLIREACVELIEDEEDICEGMKALAENKDGTISWEECQQLREHARR